MLSKLIIALAVMGIGLSATTWIQHAGVNAQTKPDRVCCADKHGKGFWDTTDPFCDGPDNLPCLSCCSGLSEDGGELGVIAEGRAAVVIPRNVETIIARDRECCSPQGGDCYWDYSIPFCDKPGAVGDPTGACCSTLSEDEHELNARVSADHDHGQDHVGIVVARDRICCAPQSGACYWDYTVPFCDELGAVSANCCSTLSEDEHELNAIQTSREAHTPSQRASTDHDDSQGHVETLIARDRACCQPKYGNAYWDYTIPYCDMPDTLPCGNCCSDELGVNAQSIVPRHVETVVARARACCKPKYGKAYWDYTLPFCDGPATAPCGTCCSGLSENELGVNAQAAVPRHVETLVARQHVCCDPQTGGNCYWDDTPPPCEQPGTVVDHSGACCSGVSKDDVELNAIIRKKSREAYMLSQRASTAAEIVKKDHTADTKPLEKVRPGDGWLSRASDEGQVPAHAGGTLIKKDDGGSFKVVA